MTVMTVRLLRVESELLRRMELMMMSLVEHGVVEVTRVNKVILMVLVMEAMLELVVISSLGLAEEVEEAFMEEVELQEILQYQASLAEEGEAMELLHPMLMTWNLMTDTILPVHMVT